MSRSSIGEVAPQTRTRAVTKRDEGFLLTICDIFPPLRLELLCIVAPDVSQMVKRIDRNAQDSSRREMFPLKGYAVGVLRDLPKKTKTDGRVVP